MWFTFWIVLKYTFIIFGAAFDKLQLTESASGFSLLELLALNSIRIIHADQCIYFHNQWIQWIKKNRLTELNWLTYILRGREEERERALSACCSHNVNFNIQHLSAKTWNNIMMKISTSSDWFLVSGEVESISSSFLIAQEQELFRRPNFSQTSIHSLLLFRDKLGVIIWQFNVFHFSQFISFTVVNQKYKVQVHDEYVMSGNTAVLKCQVS